MKLKVPFINQKQISDDCGLACLAMILQFYGISKTISELNKSIKVYVGIGTSMPQLGAYLLDNGFDVKFISLNPHLFTYPLSKKPLGNFSQYFKLLYTQIKHTQKKRVLTYFQKFITLGGKIKVALPTIQDIKKEISAGRPVLSLLTSKFLSSSSPGFNFHFHVITGIDNTYVYIQDPLQKNHKEEKYPLAIYMYALYASAYADIDNASLMTIKKHI